MNRAIAESTLLLLLAEWREHIENRARAEEAPRIVLSLHGRSSPAEIRWQAAILRMVSVIESYVDSLNREYLTNVLEKKVEESAALVRRLDDFASVNWDQRRAALEDFYAVDFKDSQEWHRLRGAIEARNAVVHGLGRLTRTRRKLSRVESLLRQIGVEVAGGQLVISEVTVCEVYKTCVEFVYWVDDSC